MGLIRMAARSARNTGRSYRRYKRRIIARSRRDSARAAAKGKARRYRGPGCTIDHRSRGASERCGYCTEGREAREAKKTARKVAKLTVARSINSRLQQFITSEQPSAKARPRLPRQKQTIDEAQWRFLLSPDGTARALMGQRDYVRTIIRITTGVRPSLKRLTIGQGKRILEAVGADASPLWAPMRKSPAYNRYRVISRWAWLVIVLVCAFLTPVGAVFGTGVIIAVSMAKIRRFRRQRYEDRLCAASLKADPQPS